MKSCVLFLLFLVSFTQVQTQDDDEFELVQVVMVSRHGIRTPYGPVFGSVTNFTAYTNKIFPDNNTWGMTYDAFADQELTPHGKEVLPFMGSYYRERFYADGLFNLTDCEKITCFADGASTRDIQTAQLWLEGFGCDQDEVPVIVVTHDQNVEMEPVLSDSVTGGDCTVSNEEQVNGLYGGDVDALTDMYYDHILGVQKVLAMPVDASLCEQANPDFDTSDNCTFFETGYEYTGVYYEGMFRSPVFYSAYFAETWMLQYVSGLADWGFDLLSLPELVNLYDLHIQVLWFGTNFWNSQTYSSEQLSYIVASLEQAVKGKNIKGVNQDHDDKLVLLVSHDTNILYLQRLLDLNWIPKGFGNRVASTGGTLSFELYKHQSTKEHYVKLHYDAASPEQQHYAEQLDLDNPPSISELVIPECGEAMCPWDKFKDYALSRINSECIISSPLRKFSKNQDNDDNDSDVWEGVAIVMIVLVCVLVFALVVVYSRLNRLTRTYQVE